jgi:predicted transcriptional regulator
MVVGRLSLTDAIQAFRNSMVESALFRQNGSRRAAARLLGVTRPAVQRVLRLLPR